MSSSASSLSPTLSLDLKQRWIQGDRVPVESYCQRHPTLARNLGVLLDLIEAEFSVREELGDAPSLEEYLTRFPQLSAQLQKLLSGKSARPSGSTEPDHASLQRTRRFTCPFCNAVLPDLQSDNVQCGKCHRHVHVLTETTSLRFRQGRMLGAFELIRPVGRGQFGEIWLARDTELQRDVAIKMPRTLEAGDANSELFLREARSAARLQHPNIVPVFEADYHEDVPYIVSAFIRGTNLKDLASRQTFTPQRAAELCRTVAGALAHAHAAGIVHRDIKPGNILIDLAGTPFVTDFGLAKHTAAEEATVTPDGHLVGTPAYMSPEQARGRAPVDASTDIYSLGVTLYELLAGRRPFEGKLESVLYQIMSEEPPGPRQLNKNIPEDLETICLKAMAKNPADRFATAQAFADDLDRFLKGEPIQARRLSLAKRSLRWTRRNAMKIGAGSVIAGLGGLAGAQFFPAGVASPDGSQRIRIKLQGIEGGKDFDAKNGHLTFIPLAQFTEIPRPELAVTIDARPTAELKLLPGKYLVVAVIPDFGFHEVLRYVPGEDEIGTLPGAFPHNRWKPLPKWFELPTIRAHRDAVTAGMSFMGGSQEFHMGWPGRLDTRPHIRSVPDYYLDRAEVTIGEYRKHRKVYPRSYRDKPPPDDHPVAFLNYDEAVYYAELIGKRLPDEVEYEYAATNRGTTRFPWGDDFPSPEQSWFLGAIGGSEIDRSMMDERLVGLCSNVAEWTSSPVAQGVAYGPGGFPFPPPRENFRVIRGGDTSVTSGDAIGAKWDVLPYLRTGKRADTWQIGLGLRCARSAKPRLLVTDFSQLSS